MCNIVGTCDWALHSMILACVKSMSKLFVSSNSLVGCLGFYRGKLTSYIPIAGRGALGDWNARVAGLGDFGHEIIINHRILRHSEHIVYRRHHIADALLVQLQSTLDHLFLILVEVILGLAN